MEQRTMYQQSQLPNMLIFSDFEGDMDSSQCNSQDSFTFFFKKKSLLFRSNQEKNVK